MIPRMEHHPGRAASDLATAVREIIDSNLYATLATADAEGRPWASPVWFAHEGYRDFLWVSRPEARHSRNVAARPELALVIFDSTAAPGDAVYVEGRGEELEGHELEHAIAVYSRRSEAHRPRRLERRRRDGSRPASPVPHYGLGLLPAGEQRPAGRSVPVTRRQLPAVPTPGGTDGDVDIYPASLPFGRYRSA